ncbi:MAG: rhodanese-like domain-containing protein [Vicingaceae bacterium]|nr:rhodanese-like domain-containing protein [Vicingaceae bacterium]
MYVEQIFTGCLAEMAYYIESNGEAVIIDPLRETTPYIEKANSRGAKIKYVFLTHFHADFVSGHVDLAAKTGAKIVFGPNAKTTFDFHSGTDNEEFKVGDITLKLLHTPGHTMESSSYLLIDKNGKTPYIFTGDTLFIGDVGRPDLAVKSNLTQADLAGHLFDSLRNKIMTLPDNITVYPAHGAGSSCGKNMSSETFDTLGNQKNTNYALRADMIKEEFIKEVTTGLKTPPQYFPKNVGMNKGINKSYDEILTDGKIPLSVSEFKTLASNGALILDVRPTPTFIEEHIPNSLFIGLDGGFAPWVGALIEDINTPIILVVEEGKEEEAVTRLSRVGYDNTKGFLKGGISAWKSVGEETANVLSVSANEFADKLTEKTTVLDVRKDTEFFSEHVINGEVSNVPLDTSIGDLNDIENKEQYVHCAGGYRSVIAISILKAKGFHNLINVEGGFGAIKNEENIKTSEWVCSSEMA